jgi:hypothetical protein
MLCNLRPMNGLLLLRCSKQTLASSSASQDWRLLHKLHCRQPRIEPTASDQGAMVSFFHDPSCIHHNDAVCLQNGREAMRDHERRSALARLGKSRLDVTLILSIERAGGLIEQQHRRIAR